MTFLTERLVELRRHLDHLYQIRPQVEGPDSLRQELTLHNDVLFSLLTTAQLLIDISGELSARRGLRFSDYTEAVLNLSLRPEFPQSLVDALSRVPGFRNVLLHEYAKLDYQVAVNALNDLSALEDFFRIVAKLEAEEG